jgi:hypothetical protein
MADDRPRLGAVLDSSFVRTTEAAGFVLGMVG